MDEHQPVHLDDCEVKKAKRGNSMNILFKSATSILKSPKKFDIDKFNYQEDMTLDALDSKDFYANSVSKSIIPKSSYLHQSKVLKLKL